ncbi:MAG: RNA polymerase sigma factor [Planctomycetota bacterium]
MTSVSALPPPSMVDRAQFPELTQQDLRPVLACAVRFLGCDHLAQDAVQEALLSMSQQPEMPDQPVRWLLRTTVNRCRHLRRSLRRRMQHEHRATQHCELHTDCDNPLHIAAAHEIGDLITAVRDSLPAEQRRALDLYETKGQDYRTLAAKLGVPIGTVRSRLARARQALQAAVAPAAS